LRHRITFAHLPFNIPVIPHSFSLLSHHM